METEKVIGNTDKFDGLPTPMQAAARMRNAAENAKVGLPPVTGRFIHQHLTDAANTVEGGGAVADLLYGAMIPLINEWADK